MLKELRSYAESLFEMIGFGMTLSQASKKLKEKKTDFGNKIQAQNMSFTDFLKQFPDLFKINKNKVVPVEVAEGGLDAFK